MANHLHAIPDGSRRSGTLLDDFRYESDGVLFDTFQAFVPVSEASACSSLWLQTCDDPQICFQGHAEFSGENLCCLPC